MSEARNRPPFFSVVIPTYNRPHLVSRAIASVQAQSFPEFELIVADDGSSLDYRGAIEPFLADPRIKFIRAPSNRGAGAARNLGISVARGEYVAFLDDDDEFLGSFLEATYATLRADHVARHVSFCGVQWVDDSPARGKEALPRALEFQTHYPNERSLLETFLSIGTGYGLCISAKCFQEVGLFNEDLRTTEDTELFLRIADRGFLPSVTPGIHVLIHDHEGERLTGAEMFLANISEIQGLLTSFDSLFVRHPTLSDQLIAHMKCLGGMLSALEDTAAPESVQDVGVRAARRSA